MLRKLSVGDRFVDAKLSPVIVTDEPPDCATLKWFTCEMSGASNEKMALLVPTTDEIDTATTFESTPLIEPEQETVVADDHDVVRQFSFLLSMLTVGECVRYPKLRPEIVTLAIADLPAFSLSMLLIAGASNE